VNTAIEAFKIGLEKLAFRQALGRATAKDIDDYHLLKLLNLLVNDRNKGATDPLDKVYAPLGIIAPCDGVQFEPDHSTTVNELYIATAKTLYTTRKPWIENSIMFST
jgi:hypothetical protein